MSIKNIALDSKVYRRLSAFKRESESFSKAVARMLDTAQNAHTGQDILAGLSRLPGLSEEDAETMLRVPAEARREEAWEPLDLA